MSTSLGREKVRLRVVGGERASVVCIRAVGTKVPGYRQTISGVVTASTSGERPLFVWVASLPRALPPQRHCPLEPPVTASPG